MTGLDVFTATEAGAWGDWIGRADGALFYQGALFHRLEAERQEAEARLFVAHEGDRFVAIPLLLRPLPAEAGGAGLDATSVYGYWAPLVSDPAPDAETLHRCAHRIAGELREMGVVSVFARLHPLATEAAAALGELGEVATVGRTVALDLAADPAARRTAYRQNHRRDIRRLERQGIVCERDREGRHFDDFVALYRETMQRVGAASGYDFAHGYLERLAAARDPDAGLFVCREPGGAVICAGLFLEGGGVIDYHLSGTAEAYHGRAPLKLMLDRVAAHGAASGFRWLHLGGGVGARRDGLFNFKRGFGGAELAFRVWRWIVDPATYAELNRRAGVDPASESFFPVYRSPRGSLGR